ncbi:PH domain-containing protein [Candidatus Gracilibacteria bacterium]|nr:PH domain-containing protein [Candidatus Gracilibacteria bacterium]
MTHDVAKSIKLKNMRPGEETLMLVKRHWIILVVLGLYFVFGLIMTLLIYIFGNNGWTHFAVVIFWMIYSIFLYIQWLDHELDMYVITNNRIIGVEQISFLNRKVSECNLGQVQEVGSHTKGLLANLLNFGTVKIQTAGNATNFAMTYCPEALDNSRSILNIVDHYRDTHGGKSKV